MKRKIKVLRIIARLNIGGPAIHVVLLTDGLDPTRFQSTLVAGKVSRQEGDMSYLVEAADGKPIIIPELQRDLNPIKDMKSFFRVLRILGQEKPDIVHTHTAKAGSIGRIAVFAYNLIHGRKVRVVHTFHGHVFRGYFGKPKSLFFILAERLLAEMTDLIIVISESQNSELCRNYRIAPAHKFRVIPLGFDLASFLACRSDSGHSSVVSGQWSVVGGQETEVRRQKSGDNLDLELDSTEFFHSGESNKITLPEWKIGIVGRLVPIKNHKMFLESARIFLDHNPDIPARFLIIGDGELRDDLINYCQQHGLSDYVKFCGWKRDLPKAYADLDILALTSINEGTPVSIIEAMASCVPVISTDAGGVRDLLGTPIPVISQNGFQVFERGILCRQDDAEGFANGLKYIVQNGRIRQEISDCARSFVARVHSKERLLQDVESVYLELLKHDRDVVPALAVRGYSAIGEPSLKVLQIYKDYYPPVLGGMEKHINLLSHGLVARGILNEVLVSNTIPRTERYYDNSVRITKVPEYGRLQSAPLTPNFSHYLKILGREVDILHFHFPNPTAELALILSNINKPCVVTYHSDIVRQAKLAKLYSPFLLKFLKRANAIIATSPNYVQSSKVLSQFRDKCTVIPFGIDLARFAFYPEMAGEIASVRRAYGRPILLFVGRFRYYKGLHVLIEAMKNVKAKLLLIGAGPLETELQAQVAAANLQEKVLLLGELSDQNVVIHLHACDVFVLPSVLRSEAFGIVQLEAMACGKPLVCTELGTGTSFVNQHQKTGLVVRPNDAAALAQALNYLLENPEIREKYGKAGRKRVEKHFSEETMIASTIATYESVYNPSVGAFRMEPASAGIRERPSPVEKPD